MRLALYFLGLVAMVALPTTQANAGIVVPIDFSNNGVVGGFFDTTGGTSNQGFPVGAPGGTTLVDPALVPGLTITAVGTSTNGGTLNANGQALGINSTGGGDIAADIEASAGEFITFTFNQDVTLIEADFNNFDDATDSVSFGGITAVGSALTGNILTFPAGTFFAAGTPIVFAENVGDGVGLAGLTIEASQVPEPNSAIALLALAGLVANRRRRRA